MLFYRMLKQVLISGCDVEKCLNCEMGNVDHTQFEDDIQRKSVRFKHKKTIDHL